MDWRSMGIDKHIVSALHELLDLTEETSPNEKQHHPSRVYVRDAKPIANTPADLLELPNAYQYVVDMPGVKAGDMKVQLEDNVLTVSGEKRKDKEKDDKGVKYVRMERRAGKFLRRFVLAEDANTESVKAKFEDGVLSVIVEKKPAPESKKPKMIEVNVG